jgi:hypothetical protein
LKQELGRSLVSRETDLLDPVYGWVGHETAFSLVGPVDQGALERCRCAAAKTLQPAGGEVAVKELTRLGLQTKLRAEDGGTMEARLLVYAEDLAQYPADIVVDACRFWGRTEKFFPAWSELKDLLDVRVKRRKRLAAAVGHAG